MDSRHDTTFRATMYANGLHGGIDMPRRSVNFRRSSAITGRATGPRIPLKLLVEISSITASSRRSTFLDFVDSRTPTFFKSDRARIYIYVYIYIYMYRTNYLFAVWRGGRLSLEVAPRTISTGGPASASYFRIPDSNYGHRE